jgi:EAL and modified HD-GYP domain-containing signal transduction protein
MTTPQARTASPSAPEAQESLAFVGRQPILDQSQQIVAYELLFRDSAQAGVAGVADAVLATSQVLINTFLHFGIDQVLGNKPAFINVSEAMLLGSALESLPSNKVVLEILEDVRPTDAVIQRMQQLREMGYTLALDDFVYKRELEPLIAQASYIKFDVRALGMREFENQLRLLRGRGPAFLAEKVETKEEFEICQRQFVTYYQGYYFAKPQTLSTKRLDPVAHNLMQLFGLVTSHAEPSAIEEAFRRDVALSYGLLRHINSAAFGLRKEVESIRHALVILGHDKLARWLTLLMYSISSQSLAPSALYRTALNRARLAELLGEGRLGAVDRDYLFMCGMFSLLDAMLGVPLPQLLENIKLPEQASAALLRNEGPYAPYLALAQSCEQGDVARAATLAQSLGLSLVDVTRCEIEAMGWVETVSATGQ